MGLFFGQLSTRYEMLALGLVLLFASGSFSNPARVLKQRVPKFKNFPVVGIKESSDQIEPKIEYDEDIMEEHPRDARQVEQTSYEAIDGLDDVFVEEAVYLTPEDREQRALEEVQPSDEGFNFYEDESLDNNEAERPERDGAHGHHGGHRNQRGGRGGHNAAPVAFNDDEYNYDYDYEQQAPERQPQQQGRRGKQTGATGVALGVLSSPPSSDGNYNFNFANDDGSSRQEVGAPDAIRGSYSFVTPEGEQVNVQYHADETGFHATGSHVPQAPPMPAHVQRLLDHLAKVNGLERI